MSSSIPNPPRADPCESVAELLPWHANGTLSVEDRSLVDAHTEVCDACRASLALERRIVETIRAPRGNVEQSPHSGWQRLAERIDAESIPPQSQRPDRANGSGGVTHGSSMTPDHRRAGATHVSARAADSPRNSRAAGRARRWNWGAVLGAAVAVQAAAIAVLAVALVRHRQIEEAPRFHTLATPDPTLAANGPLLRIAFDSVMDEAAARELAGRVSGRILAGPSPDNVYTFVLNAADQSARGVDDKVSWLRRQSHVLLVEPVALGQPSRR